MNSKMYCIYAFYDFYCSLHTDNAISLKTKLFGSLELVPFFEYLFIITLDIKCFT